jgi:uncharacterized protein (TIGR01777 family)
MRVAVTGSHGFIGRHLAPELRASGHEVVRLVRRVAGPGDRLWDPGATPKADLLDDLDAVVHLAGAPILDRWTANHRQKVLDSRVGPTSRLAEALAARSSLGSGGHPRVLISASAVGFYGDRGDEELSERSGVGRGFLADVCRRWEAATGPAADAGIRTVLVRSGIVLSRDGGALAAQLPVFRLGLGGRLGSGRQWVSWIGIADQVGAIIHALQHPSLAGPVNLVAPVPVTNDTYTRVLAEAVHRPAWLAVPSVALRLVFGSEGADEMFLSSQRVRPDALHDSGFRFRHPELSQALRATLDA